MTHYREILHLKFPRNSYIFLFLKELSSVYNGFIVRIDPTWSNMALGVMHYTKICIASAFAGGRIQAYTIHLQIHYFVNHYFELIRKKNFDFIFWYFAYSERE